MSLNDDPGFVARLHEAFETLPSYLTSAAEFCQQFQSDDLDHVLIPVSDKLYELHPVGFICFERFHDVIDTVDDVVKHQHFGIKSSALYERTMCIRPRVRCVLPHMVKRTDLSEFVSENVVGNVALMTHRHVGGGVYHTIITCSEEIDAVALTLALSN